MFTIWLCAILLLLVVLLKKYQNRDFSAKMSQFDGPSALELLKRVFEVGGSPTESFRIGHEWIKKYGCFAFSSIVDTYVCTGKREDVQALSKMDGKSRIYQCFKPSLGNGLIISNGDKWKKTRVIVESLFATKELTTNIVHIFNELSSSLTDEINRIGPGVEFNIWPLILRTMTRTISETTIGSSKTQDLDISKKYGTGNKRCEQLISKRMYSPWLYPDFIFNLYLYFTYQSHVFEVIRRPFLQAIQKRKKLALERKAALLNGTIQPPSRLLILDILMESKHLTDEDLTDEIMTLMFSGSDTSATTLCLTLTMLALNPEIQEKVYTELASVLPTDPDKPIDVSEIAQLTFLKQCIEETLRKFSIVPVIVRNSTNDVTLEDGRVIPAGVNAILSIYEIHNNPEYYPNPEVWNPYNFNPEQVAKRPLNTFIPFATGNRTCVGNKYAMLSFKIFLAKILRSFRVVPTDKTKLNLVYNVMVKCKGGYHLKFEKR